MARITLIRPPLLVSAWSDSGPLTPPLACAYLASSLRQAGHDVRILDAVGEAPFQVTPLFGGRVLATGLTSEQIAGRLEEGSDLVGVSCMFSQDWPEVRRLLRLVRQHLPGVPIVVGGEHASATADFLLRTTPEVDFCVLGEGERTLVELVEALQEGREACGLPGLAWRAQGQVRLGPPRPRRVELDQIPWPAWDLVPLHNYLENRLGFGVDRGRSLPVLATRGCPFRCTFCSSPGMWGPQWSARDPDRVLDEIVAAQERYGVTNFDFFDLTAILDRDWILRFTRRIGERGLGFTWQLPSGTRCEVLDDEVCRSLFRSGCRNVSFAPESGSPAVLKRIRKNVDLARLRSAVRSALRAGLNVKLNIIMGLPEDSAAELRQTIGFLVRMALDGVHDVGVTLFCPYPGSELFARLQATGRIGELGDEFFLDLGAYKDLSRSSHLACKVGSSALNRYRVAAFLAFYGTQYAVRPWRLLRLVGNFLRGREESRLDKSLRDLARRFAGRARKPTVAGTGDRLQNPPGIPPGEEERRESA